MKPNRLFLIVGLLAAIFAFAACQATMKPWGQMSPVQKAAFFVSTYNELYDGYVAATLDKEYAQANKDWLRTYRAVVVEMEPLVKLYANYAQAGHIPPRHIEEYLLTLIAKIK